MQERHLNRKRYFEEQEITTEKYVIPFIQKVKNINEQTSVLEIGCGEGGNLAPFLKRGCKKVVGIDLSQGKIENAKSFYKDKDNSNNIRFICDDIYNIDVEDIGKFDIIMMRDVIEHIHGQEKFMSFVKKFMKSDSKFFLAFPPWYNPFGGHQQGCKSKVLSKLPYFHILPSFIYKSILKLFGETEALIEGLLEVKATGISIERFERIIKNDYITDRKVLYFINPNYEIKFGLTPRVAWRLCASIPFVRNFFITTGYYIIALDNTKSQ